MCEYEPCEARTFETLVDVLGPRSARLLCRYFGGTSLYIPSSGHLDRLFRNQSIRQAAAFGTRIADLCIHYHLSDRQVRRILQPEPLPARKPAGSE